MGLSQNSRLIRYPVRMTAMSVQDMVWPMHFATAPSLFVISPTIGIDRDFDIDFWNIMGYDMGINVFQ